MKKNVYILYKEMANFSNKTFSKNDEWTTPQENWDELKEYLPTKTN